MNNQITRTISIFIAILVFSQSGLAMKSSNSPGRPGHLLDQVTATISVTWTALGLFYSNVVNLLENNNPQYYDNQAGQLGTDPETGAPTLVWDDTAEDPAPLTLEIFSVQTLIRALMDFHFPSYETGWEGDFKKTFGHEFHKAFNELSLTSIHPEGDAAGHALFFIGDHHGLGSVALTSKENAYNLLSLSTKTNMHVHTVNHIDRMVAELEKFDDATITKLVPNSHGAPKRISLGKADGDSEITLCTAGKLIDVLDRKLSRNAKIYLASCDTGNLGVGLNLCEILARAGRTVIGPTQSIEASEMDYVAETIFHGSDREAGRTASKCMRWGFTLGVVGSIISISARPETIGHLMASGMLTASGVMMTMGQVYNWFHKPTDLAYKVCLSPRPWINVLSVDAPEDIKSGTVDILRVNKLNTDCRVALRFEGKGIRANTLVLVVNPRGSILNILDALGTFIIDIFCDPRAIISNVCNFYNEPLPLIFNYLNSQPVRWLNSIAAKRVVLEDHSLDESVDLASDALFDALHPETEALVIDVRIRAHPTKVNTKITSLDLGNVKGVLIVKDFKTIFPNLVTFTTFRRVWNEMKTETHPGIATLNLDSFIPEEVCETLRDIRVRFPNVVQVNFLLLNDSADTPMSTRIEKLKAEINESLRARVEEVGVAGIKILFE